ncbi:GRIP and coiled-coil domain-containing protein 1 [Aphelenchoides besseyi]|nr:GRIP and coiled-coil domain-containing protein 1 [Aphelenchoides besseyi]KAI6209488.1 GRIP and coiled-coil domain-containing protein 1 [Aphelenchoides besseyi]
MSTTNLQTIVDEQKAQLETYEKKLKDVVHAYKSLQNEKKALEVALETLSGEKTESTANTSESSESEAPSQSEALKQAIMTLTVENKKKELAFQSDRKALLAKNEKLQTMIDTLQMNNTKTKDLNKYKEQIRRIEEEKEKMIADHGAVLASVQKRYTEEASRVQQHEKTITDLYKQIHAKDQQIQASSSIVNQFEKLQDEMLKWKKRAEQTPREVVLLQEIENLKRSHQEELELERNKRTLNKSLEVSMEARVHELESRLNELSQKNAAFEHERFELQKKIDELQKSSPEATTKQPTSSNRDYETQTKNVKLSFLKLYEKLKQSRDFDVYEVLGLERPTQPTTISNLSANRPNTPMKESCEKCDATGKDLSHFKSAVTHLQKQLRLLEESQTATKKSHDEITVSLRKRISELETVQQRTYDELTTETKRRVSELEEEMQKQRERMQQIIAEKDREIELARNSLTSFYNQKLASGDPVDPPQLRKNSSPQPHALMRQRSSTDSVRNVLAASFDEDGSWGRRSPVKRSTSNHFADNRNIFYEQELAKYEQEIMELRNMIRLSEMKVGDMESQSLTKDMQYLEIIEALKEEVRVLEGRLTLQSNNANIEYLRNIFVQFLSSSNVKASRYMLKAMAGVLKLTPLEMKRLDAWTP